MLMAKSFGLSCSDSAPSVAHRHLAPRGHRLNNAAAVNAHPKVDLAGWRKSAACSGIQFARHSGLVVDGHSMLPGGGP
jgi:hypothetical protein